MAHWYQSWSHFTNRDVHGSLFTFPSHRLWFHQEEQALLDLDTELPLFPMERSQCCLVQVERRVVAIPVRPQLLSEHDLQVRGIDEQRVGADL